MTGTPEKVDIALQSVSTTELNNNLDTQAYPEKAAIAHFKNELTAIKNDIDKRRHKKRPKAIEERVEKVEGLLNNFFIDESEIDTKDGYKVYYKLSNKYLEVGEFSESQKGADLKRILDDFLLAANEVFDNNMELANQTGEIITTTIVGLSNLKAGLPLPAPAGGPAGTPAPGKISTAAPTSGVTAPALSSLAASEKMTVDEIENSIDNISLSIGIFDNSSVLDGHALIVGNQLNTLVTRYDIKNVGSPAMLTVGKASVTPYTSGQILALHNKAKNLLSQIEERQKLRDMYDGTATLESLGSTATVLKAIKPYENFNYNRILAEMDAITRDGNYNKDNKNGKGLAAAYEKLEHAKNDRESYIELQITAVKGYGGSNTNVLTLAENNKNRASYKTALSAPVKVDGAIVSNLADLDKLFIALPVERKTFLKQGVYDQMNGVAPAQVMNNMIHQLNALGDVDYKYMSAYTKLLAKHMTGMPGYNTEAEYLKGLKEQDLKFSKNVIGPKSQVRESGYTNKEMRKERKRMEVAMDNLVDAAIVNAARGVTVNAMEATESLMRNNAFPSHNHGPNHVLSGGTRGGHDVYGSLQTMFGTDFQAYGLPMFQDALRKRLSKRKYKKYAKYFPPNVMYPIDVPVSAAVQYENDLRKASMGTSYYEQDAEGNRALKGDVKSMDALTLVLGGITDIDNPVTSPTQKKMSHLLITRRGMKKADGGFDLMAALLARQPNGTQLSLTQAQKIASHMLKDTLETDQSVIYSIRMAYSQEEAMYRDSTGRPNKGDYSKIPEGAKKAMLSKAAATGLAKGLLTDDPEQMRNILSTVYGGGRGSKDTPQTKAKGGNEGVGVAMISMIDGIKGSGTALKEPGLSDLRSGSIDGVFPQLQAGGSMGLVNNAIASGIESFGFRPDNARKAANIVTKLGAAFGIYKGVSWLYKLIKSGKDGDDNSRPGRIWRTVLAGGTLMAVGADLKMLAVGGEGGILTQAFKDNKDRVTGGGINNPEAIPSSTRMLMTLFPQVSLAKLATVIEKDGSDFRFKPGATKNLVATLGLNPAQASLLTPLLAEGDDQINILLNSGLKNMGLNTSIFDHEVSAKGGKTLQQYYVDKKALAAIMGGSAGSGGGGSAPATAPATAPGLSASKLGINNLPIPAALRTDISTKLAGMSASEIKEFEDRLALLELEMIKYTSTKGLFDEVVSRGVSLQSADPTIYKALKKGFDKESDIHALQIKMILGELPFDNRKPKADNLEMYHNEMIKLFGKAEYEAIIKDPKGTDLLKSTFEDTSVAPDNTLEVANTNHTRYVGRNTGDKKKDYTKMMVKTGTESYMYGIDDKALCIWLPGENGELKKWKVTSYTDASSSAIMPFSVTGFGFDKDGDGSKDISGASTGAAHDGFQIDVNTAVSPEYDSSMLYKLAQASKNPSVGASSVFADIPVYSASGLPVTNRKFTLQRDDAGDLPVM